MIIKTGRCLLVNKKEKAAKVLTNPKKGVD